MCCVRCVLCSHCTGWDTNGLSWYERREWCCRLDLISTRAKRDLFPTSLSLSPWRCVDDLDGLPSTPSTNSKKTRNDTFWIQKFTVFLWVLDFGWFSFRDLRLSHSYNQSMLSICVWIWIWSRVKEWRKTKIMLWKCFFSFSVSFIFLGVSSFLQHFSIDYIWTGLNCLMLMLMMMTIMMIKRRCLSPPTVALCPSFHSISSRDLVEIYIFACYNPHMYNEIKFY